MPDNQDQGPHQADYPKAPVLNSGFDDVHKLPIFWGPDQKGTGEGYVAPNPEKWRAKEPLNIPQVVRFVYAANDSYNTEEYSEPGSSPEGWVVTAIFRYVPPYPYDFVIQIKYNGVGTPYHYSTREYELVYYPNNPTPVLVNIGSNFYVGMTYTVPYRPGLTAALDWIEVGGVSGPGFYRRGSADFIVPTSTPP